MSKALQQVAGRLAISEEELQNVILNTVMPSGKQVTVEQFNTFIAVANEYKLNPLTKEVYAFPTKGGGIQPIVSIDGWLKIINSHPDFNGMTFEDNRDDSGNLVSITCNIYKKGIEHPVQVTEYMEECRMNTEPWKKYGSRMLRHKAAIQAGRYAFGLAGIIDPDEAERYKREGVIDDGTVVATQTKTEHNDEQYQKFHEYLADGTDIEFAGYIMFSLNDELLSSLYGTFEKGEKTSGKAKATKKQQSGIKALHSIAHEMQSDDEETREQAMDGLSDLEKQIAIKYAQEYAV